MFHYQLILNSFLHRSLSCLIQECYLNNPPLFCVTGEAQHLNKALIPFVPYPVNPQTGLPVVSTLKPLARKSDLEDKFAVSCAETGLQAPILGVTIHPQTGAMLPLCGTHTDPVTALPIAIEVSSASHRRVALGGPLVLAFIGFSLYYF